MSEQAVGKTAPGVSSGAAASTVLPLLSLAAFATGCGMRMLDPLLPTLAADLRVTVAEAAIVISAFALPYGLCQMVLGPLGDRFGKLRVLVLGLLLYSLAMAACSLAGSLGHLVALRAVTGGLAGAIVPLAMAWIGDNVPYADRQATLGRFLTGMVMAQLLAGPLSGVVGQALGWRAVFLLVGAQALLTGFGIMAVLGRKLWHPDKPASAGSGFSRYLTLLHRPAGRRLLTAAFVDGLLLFGGAFPFIGSYLIQVFHLEAWQAGLVVAGFGLGSLVYTRMARLLVSRLGEARVSLVGGLVLAAGLGGLALAPNWWVVAALQALLGLAFFMFHGTLQARSTEALPEARATAVSAFAMALFLGQALGSICFGAVMARAGYPGAFLIAGVAMAALALWTRATLLAR
ncbi:MFS transporter [Pseudoroseomonas wenyumeiae]|uniref:MFS transporter n=1 Tax=Teichococcus wenyumeiae TaxID=2478470 RepID=A0A3A9JPB6_9PROT|nr:MFS transporter [Pseudoroseomonas wenyumeiae]RKK02488.1 MFS transporter [Pseudoroseomonas wenyumeiae]RMI25244.1 MFS transporter [Pseudoroseomonas wenyumeiae]